MSAKNNAWALALVKLVFQNVPVALVGDAGGILGSVAAGNVYLAAHTADPKVDGNQQSNEAAFGGYLRSAIERSTAKWTCDLVDDEIGPARAMNIGSVVFPPCTSGTATITHMSLGLSAIGSGFVLYSSQLTEPRLVSAGIRLVFDPGDLVFTED